MFLREEELPEKRIASASSKRRGRRCLSCGAEDIKPGRRYCSRQCRQKLLWVLSLSKGLLQTLNARYAAFSFTDHYVALDIMPAWSRSVSHFVYERRPGYPPAHALKELILEAGKEWYQKRSRRISRSFASQSILEEKVENTINPDSIKPNANKIPRLSAEQKKGLKHLNIPIDILMLGDYVSVIKRAYRGMAKIHHPDKGGDSERFKEINRAHVLMQEWLENPTFRSNHSLPGSWSYSGYKNKWSPPLSH